METRDQAAEIRGSKKVGKSERYTSVEKSLNLSTIQKSRQRQKPLPAMELLDNLFPSSDHCSQKAWGNQITARCVEGQD